jgi:hypothetical protein
MSCTVTNRDSTLHRYFNMYVSLTALLISMISVSTVQAQINAVWDCRYLPNVCENMC